MIICSCLCITSSDIKNLSKEGVVQSVKDVYTEFQQGNTEHKPCNCCPKMIKQCLEE